MDKKIKNKWLKALTGKLTKKYVQGRARLNSTVGFCCLGVLADIQGCKWLPADDPNAFYPVIKGKANKGNSRAGLLNPSLAGGLRTKQQSQLANMNDNGKSFEEIAAYIKKHYK